MPRPVSALVCLVGLCACADKSEPPADAGRPEGSTTTSQTDTGTRVVVDTDTATGGATADTWPWQTRFPTADTATGSRRTCDPGADDALTTPAVVSTDKLTGCMAGRTRVELAAPLTLGSVPDPSLGPGSASCVSDTLSFPVSSELTATVPTSVQVATWDLLTGSRTAVHELLMDGPGNQVLSITAPGLCEPAVAGVLHTRCEGVRNQANGIGQSGFAGWTTGSGLFEVSVPWGDDIDEMWVWVLVDRHELALGPWPAVRDGDDWSLEKSWVGVNLGTDGDDVQVGVIGCLADAPVASRVVP